MLNIHRTFGCNKKHLIIAAKHLANHKLSYPSNLTQTLILPMSLNIPNEPCICNKLAQSRKQRESPQKRFSKIKDNLLNLN